MKSATARIAVPIQISVQRSLLAADDVVAVGGTGTSSSAGIARLETFAASVWALISIVVVWAASSELESRNRIVIGPFDSG